MIPIVVISTEPSQRTFYAQRLSHEGFHVNILPSAEEGLNYLLHHQEPCVALIDVTMPANILIGLLTVLTVTPTLRVHTAFAGVGDLPFIWREDIVQLMHEIRMPLIDNAFPLSREVAHLALNLQAVA